jgi:nitrogen regulatory protein PII
MERRLPGSKQGQQIAQKQLDRQRGSNQRLESESENKGNSNNQGDVPSRLEQLRFTHHRFSSHLPVRGQLRTMEQTSHDIIPLIDGRYVAKLLSDAERTPESFYSIDDYPMPKEPIPGHNILNKVQGRIEHLINVNRGLTKSDALVRVTMDEIDEATRREYRQEKALYQQQSNEAVISEQTSNRGKRSARDISSNSPLSECTPSEESDSGSDYKSSQEAYNTKKDKGKGKAPDFGSDHENEETASSTYINDRPSDFIISKEHIPVLVDAIIASQQLGQQFSGKAFLHRIGCSRSTIVIANTDEQAWRDYLKSKRLDKAIHEKINYKIYMMQESNLYKKRQRSQVANMSKKAVEAKQQRDRERKLTDTQKEAKRQRSRIASMTDDKVEAERKRHLNKYRTDEQIEAKRQRGRVGDMSDERIEAKRTRDREYQQRRRREK